MTDKTPEEIALERIEEVIKTGDTELDLSQLLLSKLPAKMWALKNLKKLDLGRNNIDDLPKEIIHLSSLQELNLRDQISGFHV